MENPFSTILDRLDKIESLICKQSVNQEPAANKISQIVTTEQLSKILNLSDTTIVTYRKKGLIPYFTVGGAVRFDLNKVLDSLQTKKHSKSKQQTAYETK